MVGGNWVLYWEFRLRESGHFLKGCWRREQIQQLRYWVSLNYVTRQWILLNWWFTFYKLNYKLEASHMYLVSNLSVISDWIMNLCRRYIFLLNHEYLKIVGYVWYLEAKNIVFNIFFVHLLADIQMWINYKFVDASWFETKTIWLLSVAQNPEENGENVHFQIFRIKFYFNDFPK